MQAPVAQQAASYASVGLGGRASAGGNGLLPALPPVAVFYAVMQAACYVVCFTAGLLRSHPGGAAFLASLPWGPCIACPLDPLSRCLPSVGAEFVRVARVLGLATPAELRASASYARLAGEEGGGAPVAAAEADSDSDDDSSSSSSSSSVGEGPRAVATAGGSGGRAMSVSDVSGASDPAVPVAHAGGGDGALPRSPAAAAATVVSPLPLPAQSASARTAVLTPRAAKAAADAAAAAAATSAAAEQQQPAPTDSFFPFDPYLLVRSGAYIAPIYRHWGDAALGDDEDEEGEPAAGGEEEDGCDAGDASGERSRQVSVASSAQSSSLAPAAAPGPSAYPSFGGVDDDDDAALLARGGKGKLLLDDLNDDEEDEEEEDEEEGGEEEAGDEEDEEEAGELSGGGAKAAFTASVSDRIRRSLGLAAAPLPSSGAAHGTGSVGRTPLLGGLAVQHHPALPSLSLLDDSPPDLPAAAGNRANRLGAAATPSDPPVAQPRGSGAAGDLDAFMRAGDVDDELIQALEIDLPWSSAGGSAKPPLGAAPVSARGAASARSSGVMPGSATATGSAVAPVVGQQRRGGAAVMREDPSSGQAARAAALRGRLRRGGLSFDESAYYESVLLAADEEESDGAGGDDDESDSASYDDAGGEGGGGEAAVAVADLRGRLSTASGDSLPAAASAAAPASRRPLRSSASTDEGGGASDSGGSSSAESDQDDAGEEDAHFPGDAFHHHGRGGVGKHGKNRRPRGAARSGPDGGVVLGGSGQAEAVAGAIVADSAFGFSRITEPSYAPVFAGPGVASSPLTSSAAAAPPSAGGRVSKASKTLARRRLQAQTQVRHVARTSQRQPRGASLSMDSSAAEDSQASLRVIRRGAGGAAAAAPLPAAAVSKRRREPSANSSRGSAVSSRASSASDALAPLAVPLRQQQPPELLLQQLLPPPVAAAAATAAAAALHRGVGSAQSTSGVRPALALGAAASGSRAIPASIAPGLLVPLAPVPPRPAVATAPRPAQSPLRSPSASPVSDAPPWDVFASLMGKAADSAAAAAPPLVPTFIVPRSAGLTYASVASAHTPTAARGGVAEGRGVGGANIAVSAGPPQQQAAALLSKDRVPTSTAIAASADSDPSDRCLKPSRKKRGRLDVQAVATLQG